MANVFLGTMPRQQPDYRPMQQALATLQSSIQSIVKQKMATQLMAKQEVFQKELLKLQQDFRASQSSEDKIYELEQARVDREFKVGQATTKFEREKALLKIDATNAASAARWKTLEKTAAKLYGDFTKAKAAIVMENIKHGHRMEQAAVGRTPTERQLRADERAEEGLTLQSRSFLRSVTGEEKREKINVAEADLTAAQKALLKLEKFQGRLHVVEGQTVPVKFGRDPLVETVSQATKTGRPVMYLTSAGVERLLKPGMADWKKAKTIDELIVQAQKRVDAAFAVHQMALRGQTPKTQLAKKPPAAKKKLDRVKARYYLGLAEVELRNESSDEPTKAAIDKRAAELARKDGYDI